MAAEFESEAVRQKNLAAIFALETGYNPNSQVKAEQSTKTFTALVAPFGAGKTVISDEVIRIEPKIQLINTSTTRRRKPEDHPKFRTADEGVTTQWFLEKVEQGNLTNFSVIPNTDAYGTLPEDFPGEYTIGPFLPSGLEHINASGFKTINAVYIVTPGELWRRFVNKSRRNLSDERFRSRALESIDSTEYALKHLEDFIFVKNETEGTDGIAKLARTIIDITLNNSQEGALTPEEAETYLREMKAVAEDFAGK